MLRSVNAFTPRAQQTLVLAKKSAELHGSSQVDENHLADALVRLGAGVHWEVWRTLGFDIERFSGSLEEHFARTRRAEALSAGSIPYAPGVKKMLVLAGKTAKSFRHHYVGIEHYLLAFFRIESFTTTLFEEMGLEYDQVCAAVLKELDLHWTEAGETKKPRWQGIWQALVKLVSGR